MEIKSSKCRDANRVALKTVVSILKSILLVFSLVPNRYFFSQYFRHQIILNWCDIFFKSSKTWSILQTHMQMGQGEGHRLAWFDQSQPVIQSLFF